jgi:hypothetical protein
LRRVFWLIGTGSNRESFFVHHAHFPGASDPCGALKTTLKAEIDEEGGATLYSGSSPPSVQRLRSRDRGSSHAKIALTLSGDTMTESDKPKTSSEADLLPSITSGPLVFISHDARDAELAEAFSKLLKSVSAGMIKTFRSSDKKGTEGIDFGEEWYKRLLIRADIV